MSKNRHNTNHNNHRDDIHPGMIIDFRDPLDRTPLEPDAYLIKINDEEGPMYWVVRKAA